jgi:hypothetical protein
MLRSYLTAVAFLVPVLALWAVVQIGWRRVFGRAGSDPDVLAGRKGCGGGCGDDEEFK